MKEQSESNSEKMEHVCAETTKTVANRLVEALGPPPDEDQFLEDAIAIPEIPDGIREMPFSQRYVLVEDIRSFHVPRGISYPLALDLYSMTRFGYRGKDFSGPEGGSAVERLAKECGGVLADSGGGPGREKGASSMVLLGMSGVGKTTEANTALEMFDQVVVHEDYPGAVRKIQITYLKVDCPPNATAAGFLDAILQEFQRALARAGVEFPKMRSRMTVDQRMLEVVKMAQTFSLGLLVLDEAQGMLEGRGNGHGMGSVLTTLTNVCQVPILYIGTNQFGDMLSTEFRTVRRVASNKVMELERFKESDRLWADYLETLWGLQYTKTPTPLDEGLMKSMYDHTQGIPAVVNAVYAGVQRFVMLDEGNPAETIRPRDIDRFCRQYLPHYSSIIRAIKEGDIRTLGNYGDVLLDWSKAAFKPKADIKDTEDKIIQNVAKHKERRESIRETLERTLKESGAFGDFSDETISACVSRVLADNPGAKEADESLRRQCLSAALGECSKEESPPGPREGGGSADGTGDSAAGLVRTGEVSYERLDALGLVARGDGHV